MIILYIVFVGLLLTTPAQPLFTTVNSLYSGNCSDLKLVSSLARVRNSGSLFQSNVCTYFCPGFSCFPYHQGVRYSGVSPRRKLTVFRGHLYSRDTCLGPEG